MHKNLATNYKVTSKKYVDSLDVGGSKYYETVQKYKGYNTRCTLTVKAIK